MVPAFRPPTTPPGQAPDRTPTVSGEPLNILWCGDEPDFIEDGTVAHTALSASVEPINDLCPEGTHKFVPLRSDCVKCGALYSAEPSAPVAVVPDGYRIMPRHLTAENGAKALLLGEFKLRVITECPECGELEEPTEGCDICDAEGEYGQKHTIPWDQIKFIYSKAVEGLAVKAEPAKS